MWVGIGYVIILACVLGGYAMAGGHLAALFQPLELLIIFGAALGALVVANGLDLTKATFKAIAGLFKPSPVGGTFARDLLSLLFELLNKARRDGMLAIEGDVERPEESELFGKYPAVVARHDVRDFVVDYFRPLVAGGVDPFELDAAMEAEIDTHAEEGGHTVHAVTRMADGLPGFGIVAAVMGVVHTMEALSEPPEVLGGMIAAALVGTFLGILLAYGFVTPLANLMEQREGERLRMLHCAKAVILAASRGATPANAVEAGRHVLFPEHRPSFAEMEEHLKEIRSADAPLRAAA